MEPEEPPDRRRVEARPPEDLRGVQRAAGDHDRVGVDGLAADLDSGRAAALDTTRSTGEFARSSSRPRAQASAMYVFPVDLPAFVGQPWRHEPQCMQLPSVYE